MNDKINQLNYLPKPHNDFILLIIGEKFVFILCIFILTSILAAIIRFIFLKRKGK